VLARADRVICVSESTRRDLLELYEVDPARVSVVLLAASILPSKEEPMDFGAPYFLHVGARYLYKNFNGLIAAFGEAQLHRTHKLVSFSAVPLTDAELTAMERAGVPKERVIRVGGDDNVLARYYAGAEALVFPSMYEGFGIPLLEAMRCSCPIITSNISSLPEVAGDAAIYCDPGDIKSIAEAMVKIASSPEARKNLIAKGIQRAQRFSWDCCAEETYAVYCDLLSHS
jgi:glycosyltransferase involved in cell wall biosynthesis